MNTHEAYNLLCRDGNLRVPCSRYGHDTETCAEVAVRVWELTEAESPSDDPAASLDYIMGLVVNDSDSPEHTLRHYGTAEDHERFEVPVWIVTENTPGYLPESDPATFQTFAEAVEYARAEAAESNEGLYDGQATVAEAVGDDYARFDIAHLGQPHDLGRVIEVCRIED